MSLQPSTEKPAMNETAIRDLFLEKKYLALVENAEAVLRASPGDLSAHYCAGLAYLLTDAFMKGFSHFLEIINVYMKGPKKAMAEKESRLFIGRSALQLALLAEYFRLVFPEGRMSFHCSDTGARVALDIGIEAGDRELEKAAQRILSRQIWVVNSSGLEIGFLKPESPGTLQIEPTNYCNVRCRMCPYLLMKREKGYLDENLLRDILSGWSNSKGELTVVNLLTGEAALFLRPSVVKLFFMGEPLLHPKIDGLISMIRQAGSYVGIQTNGVLLKDPGLRRRILAAKPTTIGFSMDGIDRASYEATRQGSDWQVISGNIEALYHLRKEMGLQDAIKFIICTILNKHDDGHMQRAEKFFAPLRPFVDNINYLGLDRKYDGAFFDDSGLITSYHKAEPTQLAADRPACAEPLNKLNILWDGTITPCCSDIDGEMKLGHAREGVDIVWNNDKTLALHKAIIANNFDAFPFCRACLAGNLNK